MRNLIVVAIVVFGFCRPVQAQDIENQESESSTLSNRERAILFAAEHSFCRVEGIRFVRPLGSAALLNVCGTERLYRPRGDTFIDLGPRALVVAAARSDFNETPPIHPRETAVPVGRLGSDPALWGTGLGLLVASYGVGVGLSTAITSQERLNHQNPGLVSLFSFIPIGGPAIALGHLRDITGGHIVFAVVDGLAQFAAWILIITGSHRRVRGNPTRFTGSGFSYQF